VEHTARLQDLLGFLALGAPPVVAAARGVKLRQKPIGDR